MGTCIKGVIAAAGLSRRMGAFKPLMPINGRPMIERSVMSMLSADVEEVVVVLGYRAREIEEEGRRLVAAASDRCEQILRDDRDKLETVASYLLEHETMEQEAFLAVFGEAPALSLKKEET